MQLYQKSLQICYMKKKDLKYFFEVTKEVERLQQNALVKLHFTDSKTEDHRTACFEYNIFHNNLKNNFYGQVYSYKYCKLPPK